MITLHSAIEQRSPEWFALRNGKVGSSEAHLVTSAGRNGKEAFGRRDLRIALAVARIGGHNQAEAPTFVSAAMQHGIDCEATARISYEIQHSVTVEEVGYLTNSEVPGCGLSPDGLISNTGLVEIKCPKAATHWNTLRLALQGASDTPTPLDGIPPSNQAQVLHALLVSGRDHLDFVSFCPAFPPSLQLYTHRVERGEVHEDIEAYHTTLEGFLEEVEATADAMSSLMTL